MERRDVLELRRLPKGDKGLHFRTGEKGDSRTNDELLVNY